MGSRSFTVLLVESSQLVLEAIADMFRELAGVTVVGTTTNLSAAFMLAERERTDLVLVDAWMGSVGVAALVGKFRACSPGSAMAITASRCDEDIAGRATQAGAPGCFEKDSLLAAMPGLLGRLGGPGGRAQTHPDGDPVSIRRQGVRRGDDFSSDESAPGPIRPPPWQLPELTDVALISR